jgi:hypothetical protein
MTLRLKLCGCDNILSVLYRTDVRYNNPERTTVQHSCDEECVFGRNADNRSDTGVKCRNA